VNTQNIQQLTHFLLKRVVKRGARLIRHFREGTIHERLVWGIKQGVVLIKLSPEERCIQRKSRRWATAMAEQRPLEMKVEGGARLRLYRHSALARNIYAYGFEKRERIFTSRYLRPGDIFVDVGANMGLFTVIAANQVGSRGRVYSFEPVWRTRQWLEENVHLNQFDNVSVQALGLSDTEGQMEILVPNNGYDAWSSLATPIAGTDFHKEQIETTTWDEFCKRINGQRVTMMKLDVEGWENRVLDGAEGMLSKEGAPLLQVEFADAAANSAGSSCQDLYRHLEQLGYRVCKYDVEKNRLLPDPIQECYPYDNLFATKRLADDNQRLALN